MARMSTNSFSDSIFLLLAQGLFWRLNSKTQRILSSFKLRRIPREMKHIRRALMISLRKDVSRTEPAPAMESKANEEITWLSRTNSRRGENPDSGGETVRTEAFGFACSIGVVGDGGEVERDDVGGCEHNEQSVKEQSTLTSLARNSPPALRHCP